MNIEPKGVFHYFEEIAAIPHGSRNTKAISDYLVGFAKDHGLEVIQDASNNVIIFAPGTPGYEKSQPVIIQGHMDMVCEKEKDCSIDFTKDGLSLYVDGDDLKARGTTLGGDDGIAVAYALAILDDKTLEHPPLEVIITVDEEIGMLGAYDIDVSMCKGRRMLNIDSDEEGHFLTSCAGGMSLNASIPVTRINLEGQLVSLTLTGLMGGHSGSEIDKERGNSNILMGRLLAGLGQECTYSMVSMAGGLKDNAIARETVCQLLMPGDQVEAAQAYCHAFEATLKKEFALTDPEVCILFEEQESGSFSVLDFGSLNRLIYYLCVVPNGVQHMSPYMPGLVETSLNLGILELKEDKLSTVTSIRSSVSSRKQALCQKASMIIEMAGGEAWVEGDYPAWEYCPESQMREQMAGIWKDLFGEDLVFEAIHAGLECGLFAQKLPGLDCVSFGPTNKEIHTPRERLSISSTQKYWKFLLAYLEQAK